jgi:hypothetical protein
MPAHLQSDQAFYMSVAKHIASGQGVSYHGKATAFVTPGYPALVASVVAMAPSRAVLVVVMAQALFLSLTGLLVRSIGKGIGLGQNARIVAQYLTAWYVPLVLAAASILTEVPFVLSTTLLVWLWMVMVAQWTPMGAPRRGGLLVAVAAVSFSTLAVRPTGALVILALIIATLVLAVTGHRAGSRASLICVVAACVGAVAFVAVWGARNESAIGRFVPFSTEGNQVAFFGNQLATGGEGDWTTLRLTIGDSAAARMRTLPTLQRVDRFGSLLRSEVTGHPVQVLALMPRKALRFWFNVGFARAPSRSSLMVAAANAAILLGALTFIVWARRRVTSSRPGLLLVIVTFSLLLFAAHLATFAVVRYSYPAIVLLMAPAVGGGAYLWQSLRARAHPRR